MFVGVWNVDGYMEQLSETVVEKGKIEAQCSCQIPCYSTALKMLDCDLVKQSSFKYGHSPV